MATDSSSPGHTPAFVGHLTGCQSLLYGFICALLGGAEGAGDVLQETNIVLWNKAHEYDPARPFLPWAYTFARFQVMAWRKKQSRSRLVLGRPENVIAAGLYRIRKALMQCVKSRIAEQEVGL